MTSPYPVWLLTWLYSPNREGEAVGGEEEEREREERNEKEKDINTVLITERLL